MLVSCAKANWTPLYKPLISEELRHGKIWGICLKWCDFSCEHATSEGTDDAAGGCRREMVVYCKKHQKLVKKNNFCIDDLREMLKKDPDYQRLFGTARDD